MSGYYGDLAEGDSLHIDFHTKDVANAPTTLAGSPVVSVYKDNAVGTEKTSAEAYITLTVDIDGLTGSHQVVIDTSGDSFFSPGSDYTVRVTTGTVDAVSYIGHIIGSFSIENRRGPASLVADEVLTGATHNVPTSLGRRIRTLQDFGVYENGALWLNTMTGQSGTTDFENCTVSNPGDNLPDALTIAASVGLPTLHLAQGSSVTFIETMDDYEFLGLDYQIALGAQQVDNTTITGAVLTGICTGNGGSLLLERCKIGAATFPEVAIVGSALVGPITANEAGTYFFDRCASAVAGTVAPIFDFGLGLGAQQLNMRHYSGGIHIKNMTALDNMSLEGHGQLVIDASCTGGTIAIRGHFTVTDNTSGAVTLSDAARFDTAVVTESIEALESYALMRAIISGNYLADESGRTIIFYDTDGSTALGTFTYPADATTRTVT